MNWGMVSLRIADYVPKEAQDKMIAEVDRVMTKGRFEAYDKFWLTYTATANSARRLPICIRKLLSGLRGIIEQAQKMSGTITY